jgi:hypothetical protein
MASIYRASRLRRLVGRLCQALAPNAQHRGSLRRPGDARLETKKPRARGGFGVTAIDFRTNPVTARRHRVVSLVTHTDIPDIVWADDETGCYAVWGKMLGQSDRRGAVWADQDRRREDVIMPDRDAELWKRTIGCRRMQECAHSSKTSRSARSPLPTRSWQRLFRSCHPIPSIG